jgi:hypothetical protein
MYAQIYTHTQVHIHSLSQATTGEFLRLWRIGEDGVQLERLLNNVSPLSMA